MCCALIAPVAVLFALMGPTELKFLLLAADAVFATIELPPIFVRVMLVLC